MCGLAKVNEAVERKWGWMWDCTTHLVHQTQWLSSNLLFNQGTGINPWCNAAVFSQESVTKYVKRDDVGHCHNTVTEFSLKGSLLGFKCGEIRAKNVGKKDDLRHSCPAFTLFLGTFVWMESAFAVGQRQHHQDLLIRLWHIIQSSYCALQFGKGIHFRIF